VAEEEGSYRDPEEAARRITELEREMYAAAEALEFEKAAELRDQITALRNRLVYD
jgi:excinuclease ABC subunit B